MKRLEEQTQRAVADFLRMAAPTLVWFAVPNGGYRTKVEAGVMKAMGQLAGVADLVFCLPDGQFASIELKAPKGRSSPAQQDFARRVTNAHGFYAVCRSVEDVAEALSCWGVRLKAWSWR